MWRADWLLTQLFFRGRGDASADGSTPSTMPTPSANEVYKQFRDAIVDNNDQQVKSTLNILQSLDHFSSVVMDEDFVDVSFSENFLTLDKRDTTTVVTRPLAELPECLKGATSDTVTVVKHALPFVKKALADLRDLIGDERMHSDDRLVADWLYRVAMLHSLTGFPSFHTERLTSSADQEKRVIGLCSSGFPSDFNSGEHGQVLDPLHEAFDSGRHMIQLKSVVQSLQQRQVGRKHVMAMRRKLASTLSEKSLTPYSIPSEFLKHNQNALASTHAAFRHRCTQLLELLTQSRSEEEYLQAKKEYENEIHTIQSRYCTVTVNGKTLSWLQVRTDTTMALDDWRHAEGVILGQVVTFGAYIRYFVAMIHIVLRKANDASLRQQQLMRRESAQKAKQERGDGHTIMPRFVKGSHTSSAQRLEQRARDQQAAARERSDALLQDRASQEQASTSNKPTHTSRAASAASADRGDRRAQKSVETQFEDDEVVRMMRELKHERRMQEAKDNREKWEGEPGQSWHENRLASDKTAIVAVLNQWNVEEFKEISDYEFVLFEHTREKQILDDVLSADATTIKRVSSFEILLAYSFYLVAVLCTKAHASSRDKSYSEASARVGSLRVPLRCLVEELVSATTTVEPAAYFIFSFVVSMIVQHSENPLCARLLSLTFNLLEDVLHHEDKLHANIERCSARYKSGEVDMLVPLLRLWKMVTTLSQIDDERKCKDLYAKLIVNVHEKTYLFKHPCFFEMYCLFVLQSGSATAVDASLDQLIKHESFLSYLRAKAGYIQHGMRAQGQKLTPLPMHDAFLQQFHDFGWLVPSVARRISGFTSLEAPYFLMELVCDVSPDLLDTNMLDPMFVFFVQNVLCSTRNQMRALANDKFYRQMIIQYASILIKYLPSANNQEWKVSIYATFMKLKEKWAMYMRDDDDDGTMATLLELEHDMMLDVLYDTTMKESLDDALKKEKLTLVEAYFAFDFFTVAIARHFGKFCLASTLFVLQSNMDEACASIVFPLTPGSRRYVAVLIYLFRNLASFDEKKKVQFEKEMQAYIFDKGRRLFFRHVHAHLGVGDSPVAFTNVWGAIFENILSSNVAANVLFKVIQNRQDFSTTELVLARDFFAMAELFDLPEDYVHFFGRIAQEGPSDFATCISLLCITLLRHALCVERGERADYKSFVKILKLGSTDSQVDLLDWITSGLHNLLRLHSTLHELDCVDLDVAAEFLIVCMRDFQVFKKSLDPKIHKFYDCLFDDATFELDGQETSHFRRLTDMGRLSSRMQQSAVSLRDDVTILESQEAKRWTCEDGRHGTFDPFTIAQTFDPRNAKGALTKFVWTYNYNYRRAHFFEI